MRTGVQPSMSMMNEIEASIKSRHVELDLATKERGDAAVHAMQLLAIRLCFISCIACEG